MRWRSDIPLIAVNHLQAHIYACRLAAGRDVFPCVGLIVSGGHTSLYRCATPLDFELLGGTIDDAAGEAFDKVASMLGLPYPGGPAIERAAAQGNPRGLRPSPAAARHGPARFQLQRAEDGRALPHFAARAPRPPMRRSTRAAWPTWPPAFRKRWSIAWSARRCWRAERTGLAHAVRRRRRGRQRPAARAAGTKKPQRRGIELHIAPLRLCTDNAVMGAIAVERLKAGLVEPLDLDVYPGLVRQPSATTLALRGDDRGIALADSPLPAPSLCPADCAGCVPPAPVPTCPCEPLCRLNVVTLPTPREHRRRRDAHVPAIGRNHARNSKTGAAGQRLNDRLVADGLLHERDADQALPRDAQVGRRRPRELAIALICCARMAWLTASWPAAALANCCSAKRLLAAAVLQIEHDQRVFVAQRNLLRAGAFRSGVP